MSSCTVNYAEFLQKKKQKTPNMSQGNAIVGKKGYTDKK